MTGNDSARRVVVEADGGARGNPGPAAFGALLRDADSGRVLAEAADRLGTATNNVAEYRALVAGLELAAAHAAGADVEVRMDSKLVVEQMSGRWKIKHPDLRPLALSAQRLAPAGTRWTWVPREQNAAADRLVNAVLDGERAGGVQVLDDLEADLEAVVPDAVLADPDNAASASPDPIVGWREREAITPTTVVLLRHGVTANTEALLFCGNRGSDPGLTEKGRQQAGRVAAWLARRAVGDPPVALGGVGAVDALVTSPLRRCRETAQVVAERLDLPVVVHEDLAEAAFGEWDGLSFEQVSSGWPDLLQAWLADPTVSPPGGEPNAAVASRATAALADLVDRHRGQTVLVVSHLTPISAMVRDALDATGPVLHRMRQAPASLTVVQRWPDGAALLRTFSYEPE